MYGVPPLNRSKIKYSEGKTQAENRKPYVQIVITTQCCWWREMDVEH